MINFTPSASFTKSVMPIAQKMAQSATSAANAMKTGATSAANAMKTGATSAANAIKTGTSNLSAALMSKGQEALKTLATAFNSLCHSVSNSGAKVSDAMVTAAISTADSVSSTIQTAGEQVSSAMGSVVTAAISTADSVSSTIQTAGGQVSTAMGSVLTAAKSTAGSVSSTIQTAGGQVSTAIGNAMPSSEQVSKMIDRTSEGIATLSLAAEAIKITVKGSMKYAESELEHLGEVGQKALEGFEKAAPLLGTAIGVVSLAIGVKEAYKGINAYTRARNLDSTVKSEHAKVTASTKELNDSTKKLNDTDKKECDQLLKDLSFSVENNDTRAGDKAKLAAIEIASGTTTVALYVVTGGISLFVSIGIMGGTVAAKKLVTHHRGAQETITLQKQRADTTERLTERLYAIQDKLNENPPNFSPADKIMLEGLKSVGLLSKQTDVSGDLSTQSSRGKIMTTLRGKQTVSDQLAAIKPNNLIHAFTKGADGIKESHESHSTAHATPHIQTERTAP